MSLDSRVKALETQLANLQQAYLQSQRNQVPITGKTDESYNKIPQIDENTTNIEINAENILSTEEGLAETYEEMNSSILEVEEALAEVYEMITG